MKKTNSDHFIQVIIFDMDGTLYPMDGDCFKESSIGKHIIFSYKKLIIEKMNANPFQADEYYNALLKNEKTYGTSMTRVLGEQFNMTREEIIKYTWGTMNLDFIYFCENNIKKLFNIMKKKGILLFLVTSAPYIWSKKVISYLQIEDFFEKIFTAEDFSRDKTLIFNEIIKLTKINPSNILSVGDQYNSDILPAKLLGMRTYHVNKINPIEHLIKEI
ncbi:MAG: HAD family hydrolase [Candidatus Gracilibacteria bacterium]|nr:HAD family hydrolase [Candidatus Gracilibacteria bacterium]MDD2908765.1 HAD family hydrolase [Candidatus Gracilibacteria bacterium]